MHNKIHIEVTSNNECIIRETANHNELSLKQVMVNYNTMINELDVQASYYSQALQELNAVQKELNDYAESTAQLQEIINKQQKLLAEKGKQNEQRACASISQGQGQAIINILDIIRDELSRANARAALKDARATTGQHANKFYNHRGEEA